MPTLEPLGNLLVVTLEPLHDEQAGRITVVHVEAMPQQVALVHAVGPEVRDVRPGQRVLISKLQGVAFGDQLLIPEGAVLAYL